MTILVAGGCGFLGSNLAAAAIGQGRDVVVLDDLSRAGATENLAWLRAQGPIEFVHGDIRVTGDVRSTIRRFLPEAIFHVAGQVAMSSSITDPRRDLEINVLGTYNVLEAVREIVPDAPVLFASTNKVYGDLDRFEHVERPTRYECLKYPDGFDESLPLDFATPYGCSKGAADQYVLDHARTFELRTAVFRHSSLYGGRQFATYDQGWMGWFCTRALEAAAGRGETFTISGDGKQVRDLLHVDDAVELYFACLERIDAVAGRAFNIGGGVTNSRSLLELFADLEASCGVRLAYTRVPARQSDQRVFIADTTRVRSAIGWTPQVSVEEGLGRMLAWLRESATP